MSLRHTTLDYHFGIDSMIGKREMMYRVEYRRFGIWRRMRVFETEDEAYGFIQDMEYFDVKDGLPFVRYRVRRVKGRPGMISPADRVFRAGVSPHGCYQFSDGTFGYVGDPEFDPEDFLEDGETEDDLNRDGRRPIGNIYIDRWTKDGEFIQGGCFLYYEGETMRDWCGRNGEPYPVKEIPEGVIEMFEAGNLEGLKKWKRDVPELKHVV